MTPLVLRPDLVFAMATALAVTACGRTEAPPASETPAPAPAAAAAPPSG